MSRDQDVLYSFEDRPTRQTRADAALMMRQLLLRLGMTEGQVERLVPAQREKLVKFTTACHLNIRWYQDSRSRQTRRYQWFAGLTVIIVVGLPLALFGAYRADSNAFAAQVGVIITGVMGGHRMLSSMLEKRNLVRHFWKAQADLKTVLYEFEDHWRDKVLCADGGRVALAPEFLADVDRQLQRANEIKHAEQEAFFARYDTVFSDLSQIAGTAHQQSREAFEALRGVGAEERASRREAHTGAARLRTERAAISRRIDVLTCELEELAQSDRDIDRMRREAIVRALEELQRRELETGMQLGAAEAELDELNHRAE